MLGATTPTWNDTVAGLIYLAAIVTTVVIFTTRFVANRRKKREQTEEPPASAAPNPWTRVLAPLTMPAIPAPTRPAPPTPRSRIDGNAGPGPRANGPQVVDLREPTAAPWTGDDRAGTPPAAPPPSVVPTATAARTIVPPRPVLTEPYVTVLGLADVKGWVVEPERRIVRELAIYLALHRDRARSGEELLAALWPARDDSLGVERDIDTVHQAVSRLRRALGSDAIPDANVTGGYLLSESVQCDWDVFCRLVSEALRADDSTDKLSQALSLVTGPPFSGIKKDSYAWVWSEFWASRITAAVVDAAHQLADRALTRGDDLLADWGACRGLEASPAEELLHEDRLKAAAVARDAARLERVWTEVTGVLGNQADAGPVGATYRRLRAELRGSG